MKKRVASLAALMLLSAAGVASAEMRAGAFTVSPFVGGYTFDGVERLQTRPVYGLRLGYDITKSLGVEATFDYVNTRPTKSGGQVPVSDVDVYNYRLEGVYNFNVDGKLVPFVALGLGGSSLNGSRVNGGTYVNNDATLNYGVGLKYFLSEDAALRADFRHIWSFHSDPAFEISRHDYWMNYEYTIGMEFLFGGKKPVVAAAKVEPPPPPPAPKAVEPPPPPPPVVVPPAPVDCQVSAWSDWSPCLNCMQTRTRTIVTPAANGGAACPAELKESQKCSGPGDEEKISLLIEWKFDKPAKKDVKLESKYLEKTNTLKDVEKQLDMVGAFLQKNGTLKVEFNGWTDSVGTAKYNKGLAQRRADAIKKYLVKKFNIEEGRITAVGQGISTKYDNKTAAGRERNRRTEMVPVTTNKCQ